MLTIILTYSDETACLRHWIDVIMRVCATTDDINFIIVDDASVAAPAVAFMNMIDLPDSLSLYRTDYMVGYNMYGCRNLAMEETKTKWNLLFNITSTMQPEDIIKINELIKSNMVNDGVVYELANSPIEKNILLVTKEDFWKAGGYDHEWIGSRGGQITTIERLLSLCTKDTLPFNITRILQPLSAADNVDNRIQKIHTLSHYDKQRSTDTIRKAIEARLTSNTPSPIQMTGWHKQL